MTEQTEEWHAASEETQDKTKSQKKKKNVKSSKSTRTAAASKGATVEEVMGKEETRNRAKELQPKQVCTENRFDVNQWNVDTPRPL